MSELERLNVRVVSGRPSKEMNGSDEDGNDAGLPPPVTGAGAGNASNNTNDMTGNQSSLTATLLNAAEIARGLGIDTNTFLTQRRNSSLAMSLLDDRRDSNIAAAAAAAAMGNGIQKNELDSHHRPLVGGGSAAAYEAARADYYRKLAEQKNKGEKIGVNDRRSLSGNQIQLPGASRRLSSIGGLLGEDSSKNQLGDSYNTTNGSSSGGGGNGGSFGLSVNPNAHYEMLKLHHMNLLNEIQETTLMMNLYQQQQLQQQHQQRKLQQEQLLTQQHILGQSVSRNNSLGLGAGLGDFNNVAAAAITGAQSTRQDVSTTNANNFQSKNVLEPTQDAHKDTGKNNAAAVAAAASELNEHEKQLQKIKEEIEERKRKLEQLEKAARTTKGPSDKEVGNNDSDDHGDDENEDENKNELGDNDNRIKIEPPTNEDIDGAEPQAKKIKTAV